MENTSINELDKLLSMAEDVSSKVLELHTKTENLKIRQWMSLISAYILMGIAFFIDKIHLLEEKIYWLSISTILILTIFIIAYSLIQFKRMRNCKADLELEKHLLNRLLIMVYEYQDHLQTNELSYTERAILDLKLQRIKFSNK